MCLCKTRTVHTVILISYRNSGHFRETATRRVKVGTLASNMTSAVVNQCMSNRMCASATIASIGESDLQSPRCCRRLSIPPMGADVDGVWRALMHCETTWGDNVLGRTARTHLNELRAVTVDQWRSKNTLREVVSGQGRRRQGETWQRSRSLSSRWAAARRGLCRGSFFSLDTCAAGVAPRVDELARVQLPFERGVTTPSS